MLEVSRLTVNQITSFFLLKCFKKLARKVKLTSLLQQIFRYHADLKILSEQHAFAYPSVESRFMKYKKTRLFMNF